MTQHQFKIEGDFLFRTNHLCKLVKRDMQKLLFTGYPEHRIVRFFELRDCLYTLKPHHCITSIISHTAPDKVVLRSQVESFINKLAKRIALIDPLIVDNCFSGVSLTVDSLSDKELVATTKILIQLSQDNPVLFEKLHINDATLNSLATVLSQFCTAVDENNQTMANMVLYNIESKSITTEICEIMLELCEEGQKLWENINESNALDYSICGKASLQQSVVSFL